MNSVSPSSDQEVDSYPLKDIRYVQDRAAATRPRRKGDDDHVIGGIPSNWDITATPSPNTDVTRHEDNLTGTDLDGQSKPMQQKEQIRKSVQNEVTRKDSRVMSTWDSDSDLEEQQKDKIKDFERESSDISIECLKKNKSPLKDRNDSYGEYTPDLPPADKLEEMYYENLAEPSSKSKKQSVSFLTPTRVSPVEVYSRARPTTDNRSIAKEDLQRKKDEIIGADENTDGAGCCGWLLYTFSILLIVVTLPFSLIFCIKVVQEYERAVIFRLGRLPSGGAKGPGIFFIIPCIESYTKIDLRTVSFDVPPQEVLTKDSVTVSVDAVVYYRVSNPTVSVANVENAHHSTRLLAQTTLRNILGTKNMSEILSDRESISQGMQSTLDEATDNWGIKVERVEIKDVRLPVQLQRAMAAEAEAAREARAKVIAAEGEQKASKALKEAADVMAKSSAALQLRYLQTLSSISAEKNSTIIFPLPVDLINAFIDKKS